MVEANIFLPFRTGEVPEWSKGPDCKSDGSAFGGSNPPLPTIFFIGGCGFRHDGLGGNSSVGRASAFQAEGRGFESRFPLQIIRGGTFRNRAVRLILRFGFILGEWVLTAGPAQPAALSNYREFHSAGFDPGLRGMPT